MIQTRRISSCLILGVAVVASYGWAGDGVLEINQACAVNTGCFPGDGAGFPVTVTSSGSYLLTGNLDLSASSVNTAAVSVSVDNVTIDLNGFEIAGPCLGPSVPCGPTGAGTGIVQSSDVHLAVRNGIVRNMGRDGIFAAGYALIDNVQVVSNGRFGVITGAFSTITNSIARDNGEAGFRPTTACRLVGNVSEANGTYGFQLNNAGIVAIGNVAVDNVSHGFQNFGSSGIVMADNTSRSNGGSGINTGPGSVLRNNACASNDGFGIAVSGNGTSLIGNTVWGNQDGVSVNANTTLSKNTISDNTGADVVGGGLLIDCNAIGGVASCP